MTTKDIAGRNEEESIDNNMHHLKNDSECTKLITPPNKTNGPQVAPILNTTKQKSPTFKIKRKKWRSSEHHLHKDEYNTSKIQRNPYHESYSQTSVHPPRESASSKGFQGYQLNSTQLISLFMAMFSPHPPKGNDRNCLGKTTRFRAYRLISEQLISLFNAMIPFYLNCGVNITHTKVTF